MAWALLLLTQCGAMQRAVPPRACPAQSRNVGALSFAGEEEEEGAVQGRAAGSMLSLRAQHDV